MSLWQRVLLSIGITLSENTLAEIRVTNVWPLAHRLWRADRWPALPRNDVDGQMA